MYEFVDRPVTSLDPGGRFLVWSMRSWVKAMGERTCPATVVGGAFSKWNVIRGLQPFLKMMTIFNSTGLETFHFCALPCNHVSEHEAIILSLVCSLRDWRPDSVRDMVTLLVEEDGVGELIDALTVLGAAMVDAGIFPIRNAPAAKVADQRQRGSQG